METNSEPHFAPEVSKEKGAGITATREGQNTILPCPFCGCVEAPVELGNQYEENFKLQCVNCKATTGRYRTRPEAEEAWNRRASSVGRASRSDDASSIPQNPLPVASGVEKWTVTEHGGLDVMGSGPNYYVGREVAKAIADAHNASLSLAEARAQEAEQQSLNRELRWGEGEEFRKLAEAERDRLAARLSEAEPPVGHWPSLKSEL